MQRMLSKKNTIIPCSSDADNIEIRNTGLRPSWDVFWAVETEGMAGQTTPSPSGDRESALDPRDGTDSTIRDVRDVQFVTGSSWYGEWDELGMCGAGVYKMAHGVIYEGTMNAGVFEGFGVLKYPNGGVLEGFWFGGKLKYCQYEFSDGLKWDPLLAWPYCKMPDRRYYSELQRALRPGDTEHLTNDDPPRPIPPGQYDVGDGFYSPRTKCVTDYVTGEILRIPTADEEDWIVKNCRTAELETVGHRPELYENWFEEPSKDSGSHSYSAEDKEILDLILQGGRELDSSCDFSRRGTHLSLQSKLDNSSLRELRSLFSPNSSVDFELFLKTIIRELEENRHKYSVGAESDGSKQRKPEEDENDELVKIFREIARRSTSRMKAAASFADAEDNLMTQMPSSQGQTRTLSRVFSSLSNVTASTSAALYKSVSQQIDASRIKKVLPSDDSQFMGSRVRYRVDYTDFDSTASMKNASTSGSALSMTAELKLTH